MQLFYFMFLKFFSFAFLFYLAKNFSHQVMLTVALFCLQLSGASPELVNKLIPDHVKRQLGLHFLHPVGAGT